MIGVFMGMTVKGDIQLFLTQSAAKKKIPAEIWNKKTCTHLQLLKKNSFQMFECCHKPDLTTVRFR